jgi:Dna[CI] antecedent, DciA
VAERPPRRRRHRAEPLRAADALARFRRRAGRPGGGAAEPLAAAWAGVVGEAAAAHSVPVRLSRGGVLTVACSSGAWAQELSSRREELTALLADRVPETPVGLRFVGADHALPAPPEDAPPRPLAPAPTPAQRAAGQRAAESVGDPALRALVARAAAAAAARARGGRQR